MNVKCLKCLKLRTFDRIKQDEPDKWGAKLDGLAKISKTVAPARD